MRGQSGTFGNLILVRIGQKNNWCCLVNATKDLQIVLTPSMEYYICKKNRGYQQPYTNRLVPNLLHRRQHCLYRGVAPQMQRLAATRRNNPGALPTYQTCDESRFLLPERYGYLNPTYFSACNVLLIYMCIQHLNVVPNTKPNKTHKNKKATGKSTATVLHLEPKVETQRWCAKDGV